MTPILLFGLLFSSQLMFSQNLWNNACVWSGGIPNANNNVTLNSDTWVVPEGYTAECKILTLNGAGSL
jgi:hypothetical protein